MSHHQRQRFQPPQLYSITRGNVSRIEPYGCFVKLHSSPVSGLVHISQLHANKITDVNDVVSLEDEVWVKIMDVQVESIEDPDSGRIRQRHKVKLSMKYVHQDTGQDLDPENEQLEEDMQRSSRGGGGSGGGTSRGNPNDGTGGANSMLGRALASNIGMSSAIDPGNLILKGKSGAAVAANSSFNGYALVGEDEGEPSPVLENVPMEAEKKEPVVRPMGRGRGTTLPAWMTRSDDPDGNRLGSMGGAQNEKESPYDKNGDDSETDKHKSRKRDNKRHKKERRHKHSSSSRHRSKDGSSRKHHRKKHHKERKSRDSRERDRHSSRSPSYSSHNSLSSQSVASKSMSRSKSPERHGRHLHSRSAHHLKSKKKSHHKHHHRHRSREYSRSRSRSRSRNGGRSRSPQRDSSSADFANAEEARAIMERLERRRREG